MCVCVCIYVCVYVYMYMCVYVYMYMCVYVYVCVCIYVCAYICVYMYIYIYIYVSIYNRAIALGSRVFTHGPGNWGSIPCRVIPKTQKMVLNAALLSTQHYKVRIEGKLEQSREWSSAFPYTSM